MIVPRVTHIERDLDGGAMAGENTRFGASYLAKLHKLRYVANLTTGNSKYDEVNPIYGEKDEADIVAGAFNVFWANLFGSKNWTGNVGVAFAQRDNEIDFYDNNVALISFGMLTRF